ncbi:MAG: hypothetical protein ACLPPF_04915 [Rhodomicrobium sp.]
MEIRPIKSDADYQAALKEAEALMMAAPHSPEGERLDALVTLIDAYERKHYALDLRGPAESLIKQAENSNAV